MAKKSMEKSAGQPILSPVRAPQDQGQEDLDTKQDVFLKRAGA